MDPAVPLVVPEVNGDATTGHRGIVANPNCSTIQLVVALKLLHDAARIRHMTIATYQAVSGTGKRAMEELRSQSAGALQDNVHSSVCSPDRSTRSPSAMRSKAMRRPRRHAGARDTRFWRQDDRHHRHLRRVPVWRSHWRRWDRDRARALGRRRPRAARSAPGVRVVDDPSTSSYPMPSDATGRDDVLVGRIRRDGSRRNGLALWVVADNLRKGAALNGVQIAELLHQRDLIRVPHQERVA
jgi:aspartate-semialdehyde dehydrogenase